MEGGMEVEMEVGMEVEMEVGMEGWDGIGDGVSFLSSVRGEVSEYGEKRGAKAHQRNANVTQPSTTSRSRTVDRIWDVC